MLKAIYIMAPSVLLLWSSVAVRAQGLTLDECVARACEANLQVQQQTLSVEQQQNTLQTTRFRYLPTVSGYASQSFNFGRALTIDNTYANQNTMSTSVGVQASLDLFDGLHTKRSKDVETLNLSREEATLSATKQDLALAVAQAYLQALYQQEMTAVSDSQLLLTEVQLGQKEALLSQGKAAQWQVLEARSLVAQDQMSLTQAQGNLDLAMLDLRQLLEMTDDTLQIAAPDEGWLDESRRFMATTTARDVYEASLGGRADIQAKQLAVQSAERQIKLAKSDHIPTLSLSASVGTNYYHSSGMPNASFGDQFSNNLSESIGLNLNVPIFNKCATRNSVRSAKLAHEQQQLSLANDQKTLQKTVDQAYQNAVTAESTLASAEQALEAALASYDYTERRYQQGLANATDFAESRQQRVKALSQRLQAKYELIFRVKILQMYMGA